MNVTVLSLIQHFLLYECAVVQHLFHLQLGAKKSDNPEAKPGFAGWHLRKNSRASLTGMMSGPSTTPAASPGNNEDSTGAQHGSEASARPSKAGSAAPRNSLNASVMNASFSGIALSRELVSDEKIAESRAARLRGVGRGGRAAAALAEFEDLPDLPGLSRRDVTDRNVENSPLGPMGSPPPMPALLGKVSPVGSPVLTPSGDGGVSPAGSGSSGPGRSRQVKKEPAATGVAEGGREDDAMEVDAEGDEDVEMKD